MLLSKLYRLLFFTIVDSGQFDDKVIELPQGNNQRVLRTRTYVELGANHTQIVEIMALLFFILKSQRPWFGLGVK